MQSNQSVSISSFKELALPAPIQAAVDAIGFTTPTPIQAQAIPFALEGKDVIGVAQTGTGKTAAFCLPMLTRLIADPQATGLILVPTREIALQIDTLWQDLTRRIANHRSVVIIGGVAMSPQVRALGRFPRLMIATPGRLVDHLQCRNVRLESVGMLVLDEADRMLDMGFAPQLAIIAKQLPEKRQTMFFTATWQAELDRLASRYVKSPVRLTVGTVSRAAPKVEQQLVWTTVKDKNDQLLDQLNARQGSVLIFARTKSRADRLARYLDESGVEAARIHGGRTQAQRNAALDAFRQGEVRVLVATDIAARGIDVAHIAHVVNYDLPQVPEDYVHRIGRTGRAGLSGQALSLLTPEDRGLWFAIRKLLERSGSRLPEGSNAPQMSSGSSASARPASSTGSPSPGARALGGGSVGSASGSNGSARPQGPGSRRDDRRDDRRGPRPDDRRGPRGDDRRGGSFGPRSDDRRGAPAGARTDDRRGGFRPRQEARGWGSRGGAPFNRMARSGA